MQSIEITSLVGHPPFSITVCDITHTYCYFVISGVTSAPVTITPPTQLNGVNQLLVVVTDSKGCDTMNYINCFTPTPTPTLTPTPTITPTNISCNCIAFINVGVGNLNFGYTQCNGTIFNGIIPQSTTFYFCGKSPFADENVIISINDVCVNNTCQTTEITPTPTPTNTITPTITPTNTLTPTPTPTIACPSCVGTEIEIGTQIWTICNLDVTTYANGDSIPEVTDPTAWSALTTGAWCYYNNNPANGAIYGKLYNWYAVNDTIHGGLAPSGYHIPTDAEFTQLTDYLNVQLPTGNVGGKMKSTGCWLLPNTDATNSSGFSGRPGGYRYENVSNSFSSIGEVLQLWSSTENNINSAKNRTLSTYSGNVGGGNFPKFYGFSVRLIKDL